LQFFANFLQWERHLCRPEYACRFADGISLSLAGTWQMWGMSNESLFAPFFPAGIADRCKDNSLHPAGQNDSFCFVDFRDYFN